MQAIIGVKVRDDHYPKAGEATQPAVQGSDARVAKASRNCFAKLIAILSAFFSRKPKARSDIPRPIFEPRVEIREGLTVTCRNGKPKSLELTDGTSKRRFELNGEYEYSDADLKNWIKPITAQEAQKIYERRGETDRPGMSVEDSRKADWFEAENALIGEIEKKRPVEEFGSRDNPDQIYRMEGDLVSGDVRSPILVAGFKTQEAAKQAMKANCRIIHVKDGVIRDRDRFWVVSESMKMDDFLKVLILHRWLTQSSYQFTFPDESAWECAEQALRTSRFGKVDSILFNQDPQDVFTSKLLKREGKIGDLDDTLWSVLLPCVHPPEKSIEIIDDKPLIPDPNVPYYKIRDPGPGSPDFKSPESF